MIFTKRLCLLVALGVVALLLASCSSTTSSAAAAERNGRPANTRATVTVAYLPGTEPVYIFPLFPADDDTVQEIFWFVEQFWRPLYWVGNGAGLSVNYKMSIAKPPVFSNGGKTVTITLKNWRWSDGKPITTRDVEFWINLLKAEKQNYANYTPGQFPDNITNVSYLNSRTFKITFNSSYNRTLLLENQLSLLFALPQQSWDKTSEHGKIGNYDMTTAGAREVYNFLNSQSMDLATYSTNPLWQVVDGPFRISSYQSNSEVSMVPNLKYSGPDKPKVRKIEFLNFTSDAAEYDELLSGGLDYGYVPFNDIPSDGRVKSNGYKIVPWEQAGMNYAIYNYTNPATAPLFKQLYIRQAIQHTVNQAQMIKTALYGAGVPTYGPIPSYKPQPVSISGVPLADKQEERNPYKYSVAAAISLLKAHGWTIHPDGADVCTRPGVGTSRCGVGIRRDEKLSFSFEYPTGVIQDQIEAQTLASDASAAGIAIQQRPVPVSVANSAGICTKGSSCSWETNYYYLGGWQYGVPIDYPVGTVIFGCGGAYTGGYCSPKLDLLMQQASASNSVASLYSYENFLNKNVPVIWLPLQPYQYSAISHRLVGATPQNLGYWIFPQNWQVTS